jgi:hypothetical protein
MSKTYVIWWHSKFIDEINHEAPTINAIIEKTQQTLTYLQELGRLEQQGKLSMELRGSLNPIYLTILDPTVESQVAHNPLVEEIEK